MFQVKNLAPPWGKCDPEQGQPFSVCMAKCRDRQLMKLCHCSDPYLHALNSTYNVNGTVTRSNPGVIWFGFGSVAR